MTPPEQTPGFVWVPLTDEAMKELRDAAERATPGPRVAYDDNEGDRTHRSFWKVSNDAYDTDGDAFDERPALDIGVFVGAKADADLVALTNPATVLALLNEVEGKRAPPPPAGEATPKLEKLRREYRPSMPAEVLHSWALDVCSAALDQRSEARIAELEGALREFKDASSSLLEAWDARTTVAQQIVTGKSDRELQAQAMTAMGRLRAALNRGGT